MEIIETQPRNLLGFGVEANQEVLDFDTRMEKELG